MILFPEHHFIMPFCFIVGRIAIEKGAFPVILPDERLKSLFSITVSASRLDACQIASKHRRTSKGWQLKDVHPLP